MSIDLELLSVARNYAVKLEQELRTTKRQWLKRTQTLEETLEEVEAERNELRRKLAQHQEQFEMRERAVRSRV